MRFWTPLLFAGIVIACNTSDTGEGESGNSAIGTAGKCSVTNELTGNPMTEAELAQIDDPVAKLILTTEGCPTTVSELTAKLRAADTNGCPDAGSGKVANG